MMTIKEFNECTQKLRSSSMFYMSLGSKELFHSNFLHWLSIVDWDYFIKIMHNLANTKEFWWESIHEQAPNEIEVRREDKNFDLSIWIFDSKKEVKRKDSKKDDDDGDKYSSDTQKEYKEKWIPVLILENKMKSLPYREQLEEYVDKAFNIWRKSEKASFIKDEIKDHKEKSLEEWNTNYGISLVVLSLLTPTNKAELESDIVKKIQYSKDKVSRDLQITFNWKCNTYKDLFNAFPKENINPIGMDKVFLNNIISDYKKFIDTLYSLASNDWEITENMAKNSIFLDKVHPMRSNNKDEIEKQNQLEKLRISDIREKICYDQLLKLLMDKLNDSSIRRLRKEDFNSKDSRNNFFCRTNYFHNVGLFEAIYMIKERDPNKKDDEPFFLTIQIQGNYYTHGISGKDIVKKGNNGDNEIGDFFNQIGGKDAWGEKLKFFFDFKKKVSTIAGISIKEKGTFYRYGSNFIYQCAEISEKLTIMDIIEKIVEDVNKIKSNEKELKI